MAILPEAAPLAVAAAVPPKPPYLGRGPLKLHRDGCPGARWMGAEQRRAALRVMTPCEFSVIFVDLHERPYLGETHFRLDISGDLRWFEMEKNLGNLRAAAMQPDGAFKRRQHQSWRGTNQEVRPPTRDLRPAAVASDREARDTTPVWWPRGGCERWPRSPQSLNSSLFRDGTAIASLSLFMAWPHHC